MTEPYWHLEWRVADPVNLGEYLTRVAVYEDRERLAGAVSGLLLRDDVDPACIHVRKYPEHTAMDAGVDLNKVRTAVREVAERCLEGVDGNHLADLIVDRLEAGERR